MERRGRTGAVIHPVRPGLMVLLLGSLIGCSPSYSPDTYASRAVQQANKVEAGVVAGRRQVEISADGTTGSVTGAAAGGVAGSRVGGGDVASAFAGIGGGLLGGLIGAGVEKAVGSTQAFEYVVRKPNGDMISVTQRDETPLALGQKVLVITGSQARIVPDYTVPNENPPAPPPHPSQIVDPATAPATPLTPRTAAPTQENLPPPAAAPQQSESAPAQPPAAPAAETPAPAAAPQQAAT